MNNELTRLEKLQDGEMPTSLHLRISFKCANPDECIFKIIQVLKITSRFEKGLNWPDDNYFRNHLPNWLLQTFRTYSPTELSEIIVDKSKWADIGWTFGSWLDRIRDKCWQWWSVEKKNEVIVIYLLIDGYPCSVKALEHLIVASGGELT